MSDNNRYTPTTEEGSEFENGKVPRRTSSIGVSRPRVRNDDSPFRPTSTPNTLLTLGEAVIKPDLTLHCPECNVYVEMCYLIEHRQYHRALSTLRFTPQQPPKRVKEITKRRKELISEFDNIDRNIEQIRKLNEAHDIVRAHVERTAEASREFDDSKLQEFVTGTALDCSCECVLAVGICSDANGRYKAVMEDRRVYQDYFGNDSGKAFLGLYDGHHGCFAAEVAANELHHILLQELIRFDPRTTCTCTVNMITDEASSDYEENRPYTVNSERVALHYTSTNMVQSIIHTCEKNLATLDPKFKEPGEEPSPFSKLMATALVKSYNEVDHYLSYGMDEHSRVRWSGCSALTVLLKDKDGDEIESESEEVRKLGDIHLAHSGEVRAVLVRCGRTYSLTKDHSLSNNRERNRVIKNGGKVTGQTKNDLRINGVISSTRGLGNHGDPQLKKSIRVDPHTCTVPIDEYAEFLILASRGVWEIFSDEEAAKLVGQLLPRNLLPPPSRASTGLRSLLGLLNSRNSSIQEQTIDIDLDRSSGDLDRSASGDLDPENTDLEGEKSDLDLRKSDLETEKSDLGLQKSDLEAEKSDLGLQKSDLEAEKSDIDTEKSEVDHEEDEKLLRPDTGKSSRVSFSLTKEIVEYEGGEIRSMSSLMPDQLARDQLRRDFAKEMSERLTHAAIMAGARDNITVMVVLFPGSGL